MMKKKNYGKKLLSVALACCMMGSLVACGGPSSGGSANMGVHNVAGENKLTINVWTLKLGLGSDWLKEAAERFAAANAETVYGNKTGVYIEIDDESTTLDTNIQSSGVNIYFDEHSVMNGFAQSGYLLDISDIVTDTTRVGGSLEDALYENSKSYFVASDGNYYGLPHFEHFGLPSYNRTIFNEKNSYFAAETETAKFTYESPYGSADFVDSENSLKSNGPDGKPNTDDDGLPSTLEEFIILLHYIKNTGDSCSPFIVSGRYNYYIDYLVASMTASLAGAEQMENYFNCSGDIEIVTGFTSEPIFQGISYIKKPIIETVTLKDDNAHLASHLAAKYYALAIAEILHREGFYSQESYTSTRTHLDAMLNLILEGRSDEYEKCAMLIESTYVPCLAEESGVYESYELLTGKDASTVDIRPMALPTRVSASDEAVAPCIINVQSGSACYINGNVKSNPNLAKACKDFVRFLYTEEELQYFTQSTGMGRSLKYNLKDGQEESLGTYYGTLWNMKDHVDGNNVILGFGSSAVSKKANSSLRFHLESCNIGGDTLFNYFRKSASNTARTAFDYLKIAPGTLG